MTTAFKDLPPLRQWLIETKKFTKNKDYTHLLLDNGKLKIEPVYERDFLKRYSNDVYRKYKHYICEIKTPIFKLFSDLDFFDTKELSENDLLMYTGHIQSVISEFFIEKDLDCQVIICTTDSKKTTIEGAEYIKTGVHLIWTNIYVSKQTALLLRKCLVQSLNMKFGSRSSYNSWDDVVDLTVYDQNGLRMIGSHKMGPCSVCKRSKKKICDKENCISMFNGVRKVDEGRPYFPTFVLDGKGKQSKSELKRLKKNTFHTIIQTSIRSDLKEETKHHPPIWFTFTEEKKKKPKIIPGIEDQKGIKELKPKQRVADIDARLGKVQEFIRRHLPEPYRKVNITDLFMCENNIYVAQTDSKFCMNIDREHNGNHIYFCINKNEIYQKCFCRCDTEVGRKFGKCSSYKSAGRKISTSLQKLLFPEVYKKTLKDQDYAQFIIHQNEDEQLESLLNNLEDKLFGKRKYENETYS